VRVVEGAKLANSFAHLFSFLIEEFFVAEVK
jgi:hypothetical protein